MRPDSKHAVLNEAKRTLLAMHHKAGVGHLGGNLSCIDILVTLYKWVKLPDDRFILSKGHAAGAWYAALWSAGKLDLDELFTFCSDDTALPGHPSGSAIPDLQFPTGSLGHGLSLSAGLALAAKHQASERSLYCLCSDGEWQEGSCWEALTFAVHHQLDNLVVIVDQNGLQGFGSTEQVISCSDLCPRIEAFGAHVEHIDGHDVGVIETALRHRTQTKPLVIVADTVKGRGLHNAGLLESHYLPLTQAQYEAALAALMEPSAP